MVSKKQRFRTVVLIIILAAAIVGGVFGISYYKGGVTFPWQVAVGESDDKVAAQEPETTEPKLVIQEKEKTPEVSESVQQEETAEVENIKEEASEDETENASDVATVGTKLDYYGALSVEDGRLVDSDGNPAQLVGVSTHGLSWFPEFVTADSIKALRDNWGVNVVRLAMYTSDYNGYCVGGADNQNALKDTIDEAVKAATDNDMYVILDWHILNDSNPNEYKSEAIQFFGEMVRKYESNENVIYEICNEPNGDTTWSDIKEYADEVIPVIRNVDEDALILVGTPKWSSDVEAVLEDPLEYDNIMYTYHFYGATHKSSARNQLTAALDEGLPVFISEYGFVSADGNGSVDKREAVKWMEVMSEYKLSSCIWNLSNKDEGSALIDASSDKTADFAYDELSAQGQYFFDLLEEEAYTSDSEVSDADEESESEEESIESDKSKKITDAKEKEKTLKDSEKSVEDETDSDKNSSKKTSNSRKNNR